MIHQFAKLSCGFDYKPAILQAMFARSEKHREQALDRSRVGCRFHNG